MTSYEVIVVDDCSSEPGFERLAEIENLRTVRNEENQGFVRSCNVGAAEARGEYLVFLNNDTIVTHGWLNELLQTFETFSDIGLVGAKLVYPDGRLQEAGGIVWRDASAWNLGRGGDPGSPQFNHAREVDFCSGACLMIPRRLFLELGEFDLEFAPAYYEDVDLAFRVRAAGKRVMYQPLAQIIHFEGLSCGTDLSSGHKKHQEINRERFAQRWADTLRSHRQNGESPDLEKERQVKQRVMIVDHRLPTPDKDAGSLREINLIRLLVERGFKVTFFPDNLLKMQPYTEQLQRLGVEVLHAPYIESLQQHLSQVGDLYDLALLVRADFAAKHIDTVRRYCPSARVAFDTIDLHFLREERQALLQDDAGLLRTAEETKREELGVAAKADITLVVSPAEQELLRKEAPEVNVRLLSLIHEVSEVVPPFEDRKDFFFIGGFEHPPNIDGIHWFVDEVYPLVRRAIPGIHLHIVGSKPTAEVQGLKRDDITVTGYVSDVESFFTGCRLSIAPLRYGAGIKGKINHSLANGLPCVATSLAVEGIGLEDGRDVLIADNAPSFADAVTKIYNDADLWKRLSVGGQKNIADHFSVNVARKRLGGVLEEIGLNRASRSGSA